MSTVDLDAMLGVDAPGDAELISAVRNGDTDAYGELFTRHVDAARRLARQLVAAGDVDDLVSEAFAKVLVVLQRGGGPDLAFRAYLLTAVRRLHVDRIRATSRLHTTDDLTPYDPGIPFHDTAVEGFESAAAAKAFASLPERWQMVLWHTEVEEMKPADIAPLLGMSPNSVSALAYRAREGLRQAFVSMHAQDPDNPDCAWTQDTIGAYIRGGTARRDATKVEHHLNDCRRCMAIYLELTEVNSNLRGILGPLVLGGAAAAYLKGSTALGIGAWLTGTTQGLKQLIRQNTAASAAAGVVSVAAVVGVVAATTGSEPAPEDRATTLSESDPPAPAAPGGGGRGAGGGADTATPPATADDPVVPPSPAPPSPVPPSAPAPEDRPADTTDAPPVDTPPSDKPPADVPPTDKPPVDPPPDGLPHGPGDVPGNPGHGGTPPAKGGNNPGNGDVEGKGKGKGMSGSDDATGPGQGKGGATGKRGGRANR